jgi:hypothetical protein
MATTVIIFGLGKELDDTFDFKRTSDRKCNLYTYVSKNKDMNTKKALAQVAKIAPNMVPQGYKLQSSRVGGTKIKDRSLQQLTRGDWLQMFKEVGSIKLLQKPPVAANAQAEAVLDCKGGIPNIGCMFEGDDIQQANSIVVIYPESSTLIFKSNGQDVPKDGNNGVYLSALLNFFDWDEFNFIWLAGL